MSPLIGVLVYLIIAGVWATRGVRSALHMKPRRGETLDRGDRALLLFVGAAAGAVWLPLTTILVRGWLREVLPKRWMTAMARIRRSRMHVVPPTPARRMGTRAPQVGTLRVTAHSLWPPVRSDAA